MKFVGAEQAAAAADGGRTVEASPVVTMRRVTVRQQIRRDWFLLLLVAPGLLYFLVFQYLPLLGNVVAFQDYLPHRGLLGSEWIALRNFENILGDQSIHGAIRNTLVISFAQLFLYFPAPIILALMLSSVTSTTTRRTIQNIVYLPHFISWVIIVAMFNELLGGTGLLSRISQDLGGPPVNLMANPGTFPLLVTLQAIWHGAGWGAIIYLAALLSIDPNLYEAASADGANRWRRLWHITLPGILPITMVLFLLRLGNILSVGFEQILLQRNIVGAQAGEVIDTWVYFHGVLGGDWGTAAAAGLIKGLIGAALIIGMNRLAHRMGSSGLYE